MQTEKVVLVTGGTGAIGYAIAELIASKPGYEVVILARNQTKAIRAVDDLKRATGNRNISFVIADLSRRREISDAAKNWKGPLHVIVNNAGVTPRMRQETPEGIEMQWATNVLGYCWMMKHFAPVMEKHAPARFVNVASYWAGDLDLDDPEFKQRHYNNNTAYRQSKQADRMLTVAFAERLKPKGITVNACHPGDVRSALSSDLGFGGHETPAQGAATPAWLATSPEVEGLTGRYFEHMHETDCRFGRDNYLTSKLYDICEGY